MQQQLSLIHSYPNENRSGAADAAPLLLKPNIPTQGALFCAVRTIWGGSMPIGACFFIPEEGSLPPNNAVQACRLSSLTRLQTAVIKINMAANSIIRDILHIFQ